MNFWLRSIATLLWRIVAWMLSDLQYHPISAISDVGVTCW